LYGSKNVDDEGNDNLASEEEAALDTALFVNASTRFANISDLMMFFLCFFDHLAKSLVHISSMVGDLCSLQDYYSFFKHDKYM
jgi:hypothetical protein